MGLLYELIEKANMNINRAKRDITKELFKESLIQKLSAFSFEEGNVFHYLAREDNKIHSFIVALRYNPEYIGINIRSTIGAIFYAVDLESGNMLAYGFDKSEVIQNLADNETISRVLFVSPKLRTYPILKDRFLHKIKPPLDFRTNKNLQVTAGSVVYLCMRGAAFPVLITNIKDANPYKSLLIALPSGVAFATDINRGKLQPIMIGGKHYMALKKKHLWL